jgi:Holliday junction resolvasome RuvABC endonuclease subunit
MFKEPKPIREIHRIQEGFFNKEKNLSSQERLRRIHDEAEQIIRKYGLKIKLASKKWSSTNTNSSTPVKS